MREDAGAARGFGSDNQSGAHPRVLEAIAAANAGHVTAYGDDSFTERAAALFEELFGECDVHLTLTGTGANVIGLGSIARSFDAVICPETAHINVDECGAPERIALVKLVPVATPDGKLTPALVRPYLTGFGFEHHAQPRVISISQVSEFGTVYTAEEIRVLADLAHDHGMYLHMDGARIANAAAALDVPVRDFTVDAGVDVLSFGGTKNGMIAGEAVLHFGDARRETTRYVRKQAAQLASKMRFVAAQFVAVLEDGLWLETASHANAMAARLAAGASLLPGVTITQCVQANEVFATLPPQHIAALQEAFGFYVWDESRGEVRWVTSWDTTTEDVDGLLAFMRGLLGE